MSAASKAWAVASQTKDWGDEAELQKAHRERRHALIFPREHGAWGLLLVPTVTAEGVAFRESNHVLPLLLLLGLPSQFSG
jgi:hypothetical protein